MNKKRFLNLAVCSLLVGGMPVAVTSCKDYDDDITNINTTTDGLSKQLQTLQSELNAAKDAAAAAANDVKKAQQAADQAMAEAAAATKAAAEAKAEAIKAAMDEITKLQGTISNLSSVNEEQAKQIAALAGKIEGIEKGLSNIDLTDVNKKIGENASAIVEINKQLQAVETQLTALENLKTTVSSLSADFSDLKTKVAAIDGISKDLKALQGTVAANATEIAANKKGLADANTAIAAIQKELKTISASISSEVSNAVNTIAATMTQRLTSVTLIPDLYVDGIPTISFESAKYTKKVYKNGKWVNATGAKSQFIVSNNTTEATYRLNPGTIKDADIKISDLAYVSQVATTRSADVLNDIVNVASASVGNNGRLTVKLGKSNTESLNHPQAGKIYTVSLKVPIADKHLFSEQGETEASVYSEYTRLEETYFTPELAFVPGSYSDSYNNGHLYPDSTTLYNSAAGAKVSKNLVYNKSYNLNELVEGCQLFADPKTHKPLTLEQLKGYGMEINYYVATKPYTPTSPDKTNEQAFVKLTGENGATLTPITSSGVSGNEAIIGRQPIIRAELVDAVNGNRVDVGYFKVKFTKEDMADVDINWPEIPVDGTACGGAAYNFTWKDMAEKVLEKLGTSGMSKEDFTKIYGQNFTIAPANDNNGTLAVDVVASNTDASTPVMTWSVTPAQLGNLKVGQNKATFTKTVTFTDPTELHPNVVISLKWTVTTPVTDLTLGKTDALKWKDNTMLVYVVPMPVPYDKAKDGTAEYATNILEGRLKPYVSGLLACGSYDIAYSKTNPAYVGKPLAFQNGFGHWMMTSANQANLNTITYSIDNNAQGKALATKGGTIKIDWSSNINGIAANAYVFGSMNLKVLPILKLQTLAAQGLTDDSHVVDINVKSNIRITDAFGHVVAEQATAEEPLAGDYWKYYDIQKVEFGANVMIADSPEGANKRTPASLNMTANIDSTTGILTFQNNGAPLQNNAYLLVPATVTHKWGQLEGTIAVPLYKGSVAARKARR